MVKEAPALHHRSLKSHRTYSVYGTDGTSETPLIEL